jgi:hypothetical protein
VDNNFLYVQNCAVRFTGNIFGEGTITGTGAVSSNVASGSNGIQNTVEGARMGIGPDTYLTESGTAINAVSTDGLFVNTTAQFGFIGTSNGLSYTPGTATTNIRADGNVVATFDSSGTAFTTKIAPTGNSGTCTLNGATPSVCTATVTAAAKCNCSPVGTTAVIAAGGCAVSVSSTTLTITSLASGSHDVNYWCDK